MDILEEGKLYHTAFKNTGLKKSDFFPSGRPADFSEIFGHFERPDHLDAPSATRMKSALDLIKTHWKIINNKLVKQASNSDGSGMPAGFYVHADFRACKVGEIIGQSSSDEIRIINSYLGNSFLSEQAHETDPNCLVNWLSVHRKKIKILLLRPEGKAMRLRIQTDLDITGQELTKNIFSSLNRLHKLQSDYPGQLEVRLMDEIPGISALMLQDHLFFGHFMATGHTEKSPYFEVTDTNSLIFKEIDQHFNRLWNTEYKRSDPLNQFELDKIKNALNAINTDLDFLTKHTWTASLHDLSDVLFEGKVAPFKSFLGNLTEWELRFEKPKSGVHLLAHLTIAKGVTRTASIITEKLSNRLYGHARFTNFDTSHFSIHISLDCKLDDSGVMLGYCVINSGQDSCSGYLVLQQQKLSAASHTPELPAYFQRILSFRDGSYKSLARLRNEIRDFGKFEYAGTYKMYSYGGERGGKKGIKINWLTIDEMGVARYKNKNFDELPGRATLVGNNLHLFFIHNNPDQKLKNRRNYMIISLSDNEPAQGAYYGGVQVGVSWDKKVPLAKRFVLEYQPNIQFEKQNHEVIDLYTDEYWKIAEHIRKLLSGRVKNLLGFLRTKGGISNLKDLRDEWDASIPLHEVFMDSALQNLKRNRPETALKMLLRAVNHGLSNLEQFEREAGLDAVEALRDTREYREILSIIGRADS